MISIIDKFKTTISENNGTVTVHYMYDMMTDDRPWSLTGYCEYKIVEVNNRFQQKALLLINTDMGDVIEYINKESPLVSEDLFTLDKLIRDHSLKIVGKHLSIGSLSNPLEYKK